MNIRQFLVFVGAVLASATFTRWIRDFSVARKWVFVPSSDRHVHIRPVPRLGGAAIFLTLWSLVLVSHFAPVYFGVGAHPWSNVTLKILGPATIIFVVGLTDDFCGLNAWVKFGVQTGAAALLFCNGLGITYVSIAAGHPHLGWLVRLPLTILWVLWITNAFNLIDGLDGLAAGSALFSSLVTCVVAIIFHNQGILFMTLVLAGAIAGFLPYNFNPASIFLGDCGSLLIGFLLSAIAIAGSEKSPTVVAVAIPVVSLGLPIVDVAVAVIRRFLSRKRLFGADREHIHHKLLGRGISHRQAVLVLYGVSACFGLLSLFLLNPHGAAVATVLVVTGVGILIGVQQLRYPEFSELGRAANRTLNQRHVIANDIGICRALDTLGSCTTLAQFCKILQQCLQPVGFDGFGLDLSSELPAGVAVYPFTHADGRRFAFFWNQATTPSETDWKLTFGLSTRSRKRLGSLTLHRTNVASPLWIDLDVFGATGFSDTVAAVVEKMQDSWFPKTQQTQMPGLEKADVAVA
jgi:UDP-GlcNAc:undecaprenyl-phosphate/decaprenyl-phosphate GlcNAc-1-phosphate transferase